MAQQQQQKNLKKKDRMRKHLLELRNLDLPVFFVEICDIKKIDDGTN